MFKSSFFWAKKPCPGQGRRAGDGCERGKAAGSDPGRAGDARGEDPGGQGGARAPLQEFIGMGRLPAPPPARRARLLVGQVEEN